jgi:hypothetical protein
MDSGRARGSGADGDAEGKSDSADVEKTACIESGLYSQ